MMVWNSINDRILVEAMLIQLLDVYISITRLQRINKNNMYTGHCNELIDICEHILYNQFFFFYLNQFIQRPLIPT